MATEHTLRLGIDATGARQGSGAYVRSLEDIRKKAAETTTGIERLQKAGAALTIVGARLTAFVTLPLTAAAAAFVKLASDAQETRAKFDAVFKGLSSSTRAWAREVGTALGRNQVELEGFLARLQDTFVPLGFARDRAAELSKTMTQLGIDLAAFDNADEAEVINLLTSALVGNHEAVRRFGISITEATMKAELLRMGIVGGTQAASEQEKVQARLNIILNNSADASGAAMREADGAANSFRSLASASKDAAIALGERLLPVVVPMVKNLAEMLRGLSNVNPEIIKWGLALGGAAAIMGPLATGLGLVTTGLLALAAAGGTMLAVWTGGLSLVVTGLAAFWIKTKLDAAEAAGAVDRFTESLKGMNVTSLIVQRNALAAQESTLAQGIANMQKNPRGNRGRIANAEGMLAGVKEALAAVDAALMASVTQDPITVTYTKPLQEATQEARNLFAALADLGQHGNGLAITQRDRTAPARTYGPGGIPVQSVTARGRGGVITPDAAPSLFDRAGGAAADAGGNILGGLASGAMTLLNAFNPLSLIATIFAESLKAVTPALEGLRPVVEMIAKILGAALAPVIEAMFPIFKMLAIAATYVGQVFFNIAGGIATAIGWVIQILGKAVDTLNGWFGGDGGLGKIGRDISGLGKGFLQAAGALGTARDEIKKIEFDDAARAVRDFTDALTDVPKVVNLALYRARVTGTGPVGGGATTGGGTPAGGGYGGGVTTPGARDPIPATFTIENMTIVNEAGDDEVALARKVARGTQMAFSQGIPIHMPGVVVAR